MIHDQIDNSRTKHHVRFEAKQFVLEVMETFGQTLDPSTLEKTIDRVLAALPRLDERDEAMKEIA